MSTWFSATAVVPQLREFWDLTPGQGAWLTIAVQLGFVTGAIVSAAGTVADIFSSRWVIVAGAFGAALANAAIAIVDSPGVATGLRFATGFFLAGVYPPALKLMATWFRERRGRALGILVGALTLGSAMPHLVNALGGLDWRIVVYSTSALTAFGGIIVAVGVTEGPFPFPKATFDPRQAVKVLKQREVRLASLGYFGHMWELYAMWAWYLVFFSNVIGAQRGSERAALATFAVIGIGSLGCWTGGLMGDRWSRSKTTAVMMGISGSSALASAILASAPPLVLLAIGLVWGFTVVADSAQFSTLVTEFASQTYVGTALTLQLALGFTLTISTIWLVPLIESLSGWAWALAVLAAGPALGV
ncbi:MAG: MFS transporter, partial [Actinobacteria bacterium]|nr:MFS transporter [Actinomycetota bacterium]